MILTNFKAEEGSVSSSAVTVTFPWRASKIIIINDSNNDDMQFKFNAGEGFGTLKPKEELSVYLRSKTVIVDSPSNSSVAYRIWGFG